MASRIPDVPTIHTRPPDASVHVGPPPPYTEPSRPPPYQPGYQEKQYGAGFIPPSPSGIPGVTVMGVVHFGPYPVSMKCPRCSVDMTTEILPLPGLLTYILSGGILLLGCWLGCCLIPCCIPECQDIEHRCPSCKSFVGIYRRL